DFHETLKKWRVIEIKHTRECFDTRRITAKPIHPLQEWGLPKRQLIDQLGVELVSARIDGPVRDLGLGGKIERAAHTQVGPATAIDEVEHLRLLTIGQIFLTIELKVMSVSGHRDINLVPPQSLVNRIKTRIAGPLIFSGDVEWMTEHDEFEIAPGAAQCGFEPGLLFLIQRAHDSGVHGNQRKAGSVHLKKRPALQTIFDLVILAQSFRFGD